jgi:L-iditol 2-dehydrogenase
MKPSADEIPDEMRAVLLDGIGFEHLHIGKVPTPRPGPYQMLARVEAAGICTSLIKLIEQGPDHPLVYGRDLGRWPLILGDEGAITLVQVGAGLQKMYHAGERFVIQPSIDHAPINHLERYRLGGRGIQKIAVSYTLGGHLAEYILIPEEILEAGCLLPLPERWLPHAHACMGEPISCVISAQEHHVHLQQTDGRQERSACKGLKPGGTVVVIGAGAMGRLHVDLALSQHPRLIIVADLINERLDLVTRLFGARAEGLGVGLFPFNPGEGDLNACVAAQTNSLGADDVIVAVGTRQAVETAMDLLGQGGVLDLFGGLKKGDELVGLDARAIHYKSISVTGSSGGSPWDVARALDLMASGGIDPALHITRIGDLEHAIELLNMVKAQRLDGKAVVYPHRRTREIQAVRSWTAADERKYLSQDG